jgi:hypothetical protein
MFGWRCCWCRRHQLGISERTIQSPKRYYNGRESNKSDESIQTLHSQNVNTEVVILSMSNISTAYANFESESQESML